MPEPVSARPVPKLRSSMGVGPGSASRSTRPRPRTIHVDQDQDLGAALSSSRGARGSSSNISGKSGLPSFATLLCLFSFVLPPEHETTLYFVFFFAFTTFV